MKPSALLIILLLASACHHTDDSNSDACLFTADTLLSNSPILDLTADSARTYSYQYAQSNPDSILRSLRRKGLAVHEAFNDADYLCKDAIGPRFVVVLESPSSAILGEGFTLENRGRFACATKVVRYVRVVSINEGH